MHYSVRDHKAIRTGESMANWTSSFDVSHKRIYNNLEIESAKLISANWRKSQDKSRMTPQIKMLQYGKWEQPYALWE